MSSTPVALPDDVLSGQLGLARSVVDEASLQRSVERFRQQNIVLPTFGQLADPSTIPDAARQRLIGIGRDDADAANLFRVDSEEHTSELQSL